MVFTEIVENIINIQLIGNKFKVNYSLEKIINTFGKQLKNE